MDYLSLVGLQMTNYPGLTRLSDFPRHYLRFLSELFPIMFTSPVLEREMFTV